MPFFYNFFFIAFAHIPVISKIHGNAKKTLPAECNRLNTV